MEGEVVEAGGRLLFGVGFGPVRVCGSPGLGRRGVRLFVGPHGLLGRDPGRFEELLGPCRLRRQPRGCPGRLGKGGVDVSRVVELDELRRALDDLGLAHPLAGCLIEVAGPAPERAVGSHREVVRLVVDKDETAELGDPLLVRLQEAPELLSGADEKVGSLEGGVRRELAE